MNDAVCEIFESCRWDELDTSAFLTVKYNNLKTLSSKHLPVKEKINCPCKNNRLEKINRSLVLLSII